MKTVIEMAREADLIDDTSASDWYVYQLERFAELVRADEREACAKVCYELPWKDMDHIPSNLAFAAAIRARSCPPCNEDCDQGRNCPARAST